MISSFDVTSLYSNRKEIHQVNFFFTGCHIGFKALYSIDPCILYTLREPAGELVLKKYLFFLDVATIISLPFGRVLIKKGDVYRAEVAHQTTLNTIIDPAILLQNRFL